MNRRTRQLLAVLTILLVTAITMSLIVLFTTKKEEALSGPLLTAYKDSRIQKIYKEEPVYEFVKKESKYEDFVVTYYTAGPESTGKSYGDKGYGITKSGAIVEEHVTIAVDPDVIPLGSEVYIEGIGYRVAQDTGSAIKGNKIDVYVKELKDIPSRGIHTARVAVVR